MVSILAAFICVLLGIILAEVLRILGHFITFTTLVTLVRIALPFLMIAILGLTLTGTAEMLSRVLATTRAIADTVGRAFAAM